MSPVQRSLRKLREEGWLAAVVERWNPHAHVRQDLFGFADLLAIRGGETLAVQTTTAGHVANRLEKLRGLPAVAVWLQSPARRIVVHGWAKRGARGRRKTWACREVLLPGDSSRRDRGRNEGYVRPGAVAGLAALRVGAQAAGQRPIPKHPGAIHQNVERTRKVGNR